MHRGMSAPDRQRPWCHRTAEDGLRAPAHHDSSSERSPSRHRPAVRQQQRTTMPESCTRSMSAGAKSTPRAPTTAPSLAALGPRPPLSGGPRRLRRRSDDAERAYYARARASGVCTWAAHHRRASVHTAGSPAGSGSNTDGLDPCSRCIPLFPLSTEHACRFTAAVYAGPSRQDV